MESKYFVDIERIQENSSHRIILNQIAPDSVVLECGCASGYMTRYMKEALGAKVSIVERNPSDYDKAREYAADGICADLESREWWEYYQGRKFDYILFADVLEHLRNPESVLKWAVDLLKEDGTIIASIPNIAHADILINLLNGRWNYMPLGLLDNTHIHFWAEKNLDALFQQAGLTVVEKDYAILPPYWTEQKSKDKTEGLLPAIYTLCHQPYADVYQFVYCAKKTAYACESGIPCTDHYAERHLKYWVEPPCCSEYQDDQKRLADQNAEQEQLFQPQGAQIDQLETQNRELDRSLKQQQTLIEQLELRNRETEGQKSELDTSLKQQRAYIEQLQEQNRYYKESFDIISNAFFWRITKPARMTLDILKMAFHSLKTYLPLLMQAFHVFGKQGIKGVLEEYRIQKSRLQTSKTSELPTQNAEKYSFSIIEHSDPEPIIPQEWIELLKEKPLISVIIAAKRLKERGTYLEKALESLCGQLYQGFEALLVADPTDIADANGIAERYANRISIRTVPLELEAADSWTYWRKGVSLSRGSLIGFLEQEETLTPNCLAYVLEAVNETPVRKWKLYLIPDDTVTEDGELLGEDWKEGAGCQAGGTESLLHFGVFKKEYFCEDDSAFENWLLSLGREEIFISLWKGCHGAAIKDVWDKSRVRCLAFYLPQFHEIPENNAWWGKGFTEWVNVKKAKPLYPGHDQPRIAGELGYYDLSGPEGLEVQRKQIALAREYGIYGFCYYCYWFDGGKRLLEMPLDRHLKDKSLDFPFCICWANENWTRRWDGCNEQILQPQSYSPGWARAFILDMLPYLKDERYIRLNGAPYILIYKLHDIPNPDEAIEIWRQTARENGIDQLHISAVRWTNDANENELSGYSLDSLTDFPPHLVERFDFIHENEKDFGLGHGQVMDYRKAYRYHLMMPKQNYTYFRTVMLNWDNTARRGMGATIYESFSFADYKNWLYAAKRYAIRQNRPGEDLVFINAWNEWAEGTYLEPSEPIGRTALESTKEALEWR